MRTSIYIGLLSAALHTACTHAATPIYKCTNSLGTVTFSDRACSNTHTQEQQHIAAPMTIQALPQQQIKQALGTAKRNPTRVTVIKDDNHPCGDFNPSQRRTDLVRKQVKSGMSRAEVDSMFGKALSQNSQGKLTQAVYRSDKNRKRSVRFDEHGCVP